MAEKIIVKKPLSSGRAKVPVIMQMEALECGAACLAMVLAYYGKWIPLEQVRRDCGVSRDGSKAKNILAAAKNYGLATSAFKAEPQDLVEQGTYPCIIHWNFNHFVVLNGFGKNKAYINDPARGELKISMEEFSDAFTGVVLMFEPSPEFKPEGRPKSTLQFAVKRLRGASAAIALVVITSLITSLMGIIEPGFSRVFLDRLLTGRNPDWLYPFTALFIGYAVIDIAVSSINSYYSLRINGKMDVVGSSGFMWRILRMPMEFFSQRMAGDIKQRMASNATIAENLVSTLSPVFLDSIMMIFYLVVMLRYSVILSAAGFVSALINLIMSRIIAKKNINISRVQMRDAGKLAGATVTGIDLIETIKAGGSENGFFETWSGFQASENTQYVKAEKLSSYLGLVPGIIEAVSNSIVLILGVFLAMQGRFTLGMIMLFQGFMNSFMTPARSIISARMLVQEMLTEIERIDDVMEYPDVMDFTDHLNPLDKEYEKLSGEVELRNISFGYSPLDEPLIKDFSVKIPKGGTIAFVGESGSGKSTIANLISGLYKPREGEILFDGKRIDDIDPHVFRGSLSVVDQEVILFEDTIANNIRMWDPTIENFEVIMAARDAKIHDDILKRDGGYEYRLAENGRDFSGGQRQRLEIARVLAQDPTIVILDEATSALDAKTEFDVVRSIRARGITCIVIAHRLSTIRDCDQIIVMEKGEPVERGTHDELMALDGRYKELVSA